ncbi:MAG TPA: hypothetical protein VI566_06120 [Xanthomonadales bacterium]|nr:hypothetical protein [Xanthomonadales bacterium]
MALRDIEYVERKLQWMEEQQIWPNGLRYLWTDAFGLVLYLSLYQETGDSSYRASAERLVADVYRVLGRHKGLRIGEAADRDGQYYHYLAMWIYALTCFGRIDSAYRDEAIKLVQDVHPAFVIPGRGVIWKMEENLSGPYPGYGLGAMDAYDGYAVYQLLSPDLLSAEIAQLAQLIEMSYPLLDIDQDLGLGMMLWLCHFFPAERWAMQQRTRSLYQLNGLWIDPPGYFCRQAGWRDMKFAFTNYGISLGLQAAAQWPQRVFALNQFFETYESGDEYDTNAITHVMACTAHFPGLFVQNTG